jgi:AraC-like DNA-binding protein/quercetin dioxygenase-like cupin family protein
MKRYTYEEIMDPNENIMFQEHSLTSSEIQETHTHDFLEIVYIIGGSGKHSINDVTYQVTHGDVLLINIGQTHSFKMDAKMPMTYINCILNPTFIKSDFGARDDVADILRLICMDEFKDDVICGCPQASFRGKEMMEVETLLSVMRKEYHYKKPGYHAIINGYLRVYLILFYRKIQAMTGAQPVHPSPMISPDIIKYIDDNCFQKISLQQLAKRGFYNPSYFSHIFKECMGKTLTEYIHEKRISEAARLLRQTDTAIEEISRRVGYIEKKQFYRVFKRYTGKTPGDFRKANN